MGLYTVMSRTKHKKYFVTACDVPIIDMTFVRRMVAMAREYDILLSTRDGRKPEPLFGVYDRAVLPSMQNLLDTGRRSLLALLESCRSDLALLEGNWYRNLNTREDYEEFLGSLSS
jgi:molybdenum cofactor guanylyltransferase